MTHAVAGLTRCDLFGIDLDPLTMTQAVSRCTDTVERGGHLSVGVVNAAKVVAMHKSDRLRQAVRSCDLVLADGQSVVWASRMLGAPLPERVAGVDLFMNLLATAEQRGDRVYFLGARPDVLARMLEQVSRLFPRLPVAGSHDGYYQAGQEGEVAEDIRRCQTDILFVGMSSPRKELFLDDLTGRASDSLLKLSTMGRSAGIHLLLAGQQFVAPGMEHREAILDNFHLRIGMQMQRDAVSRLQALAQPCAGYIFYVRRELRVGEPRVSANHCHLFWL